MSRDSSEGQRQRGAGCASGCDSQRGHDAQTSVVSRVRGAVSRVHVQGRSHASSQKGAARERVGVAQRQVAALRVISMIIPILAFQRGQRAAEPGVSLFGHRLQLRVLADNAERGEWRHGRDGAAPGRQLVHDHVAGKE